MTPDRYSDVGILDAQPKVGESVRQAMAEILMQFAGDLAKQGATDSNAKLGAFEDGDKTVKAEFDWNDWRATFNKGVGAESVGNLEGGQEKIVGLTTLANALHAKAEYDS